MKHVVLPGILSVVLGCSAQPDGQLETAQVNLTVKYKGAPVSDAVVTFSSQGNAPPAFGVTDANGLATLSTYGTNDGAVLGEHSVAIIKQEFDSEKQEALQESEDYLPSPGASRPPVIKDLIPKKFSQAETSGLTADVKKGGNELTFDLN